MKIITYNVNGLRSALNKGLLDWIVEANPDVLCLQELKAHPDQIDEKPFEELGYYCYWFPAEKRGYSGVGILCREKPKHVEYGMGMEVYDREGRVIRADFDGISVMSVYHPSGSSGDHRQDFKMVWLEDFLKYITELRKTCNDLVVSGDFNICHREIDIHNPVSNKNSSGFLPEEREWMSRFLDSGFIDTFRHFHPEPHRYTWWSFRANSRAKNLGWRIDYTMATRSLEGRLRGSEIDAEARHSDHCPSEVVVG
jgi:exodeoxyribonuclease-3